MSFKHQPAGAGCFYPVYKYTCSLQTPLPVYLRASLCSACQLKPTQRQLTASRRVLEQGRVDGTRRHADVAHDGSTDEHVLDGELHVSCAKPRDVQLVLTMCGYFSGSSTRMPSSRMLRNLGSATAARQIAGTGRKLPSMRRKSLDSLVDRLQRAGDAQVVLELDRDHLVGERFEESGVSGYIGLRTASRRYAAVASASI